MNSKITNAPVEQINYANILFYGCWSGLALMVLTYFLYVSGIMDPYIPLDVMTKNWTLPVHDYLANNHVPTGWGWMKLLNKGDFLNFIGIAFLAGLTIIGYIPLIFAYWKKKDMPFALIALLEDIVLCIAASGIVGGGGH